MPSHGGDNSVYLSCVNIFIVLNAVLIYLLLFYTLNANSAPPGLILSFFKKQNTGGG